MRTEPTLIANSTGEMIPIDRPPNWEIHNRGITPSFFERREPKVDEDGKIILDATGKAAEHILEFVRISQRDLVLVTPRLRR
jgi:hypothetical protein